MLVDYHEFSNYLIVNLHMFCSNMYLMLTDYNYEHTSIIDREKMVWTTRAGVFDDCFLIVLSTFNN